MTHTHYSSSFHRYTKHYRIALYVHPAAVGSVWRLRSSRGLQKGNLTELHCQRQQIITHRAQEGVSKEVRLHLNSAFHIQTGKNRYCVQRYDALCRGAGWSRSFRATLSSYELRNTLGITALPNRTNVFNTRQGFRNTLCTCIYNTQHLFPELKHCNNMCSLSACTRTHTHTHTHTHTDDKD